MVEVGDSGIQVEAGRFPNKLYEPQLVRTHTTKFILDKRVKKERVYVIQDDQEKGVSTSVSRMKKRTKVSALFFRCKCQTAAMYHTSGEKAVIEWMTYMP